MSWRPYWCSKTMKWRPCLCTKTILWELNSFLMQTLSFVPMNCIVAGHKSESALVLGIKNVRIAGLIIIIIKID